MQINMQNHLMSMHKYAKVCNCKHKYEKVWGKNQRYAKICKSLKIWKCRQKEKIDKITITTGSVA